MSLPAPILTSTRLLVACLLALSLGACQADEATSRSTNGGPARVAGETTDPGSRYLDAGGPLGGLTAETPPAAGDFVGEPSLGTGDPARRVAPTRRGPDLPEPARYASPPRPPPPPLR